jgi:hypothetical protein
MQGCRRTEGRAMKKKKKENNVMMWVGIGVGAGVLFIVILIAVVAIIVNSNAGEPQAKGPPPPIPEVNFPKPPPPPKPNNDKADIGTGKRHTSGIRGRANRVERINELRQIRLFYEQYQTEFGKAPQTVGAFVDYIKRDAPHIKQAIEEKYYVFLPKVTGSGIIAYEHDPDDHQLHGVVTIGQGPHDLTTDELVHALNQQLK